MEMKQHYKIIGGVLLALTSTFSTAVTVNAGTITKFTAPYKFGASYEFEIWGTWQLPACGNASSLIIGRSANDDLATVKAAYATVLTAYSTGSNIAFDVSCANGTTIVVNNVYMPTR